MSPRDWRPLALHSGLIVAVLLAYLVLPTYHAGLLPRVMVLAVFAMGYNLLFGYTGLLSLGHAMFFAAGMYGLGLTIQHLDFTPGPAFIVGVCAAALLSAAVGALALRTVGVAFMIVTLMFAQAGFLTALYFGEYTRGDEGFALSQAQRMLWGVDLSDETNRFVAALALFSVTLFITAAIVRSNFGKALVAVRENEERARMLGYDVTRLKLYAVILSGVFAGASGAAYALLFGYVGATFASVQYSILPLLWVLLGGAGTTIGPFIGALFMFYLIDLTSEVTDAYLLVVGVALVLLTLYARAGIVGELRRRLWGWLP